MCFFFLFSFLILRFGLRFLSGRKMRLSILIARSGLWVGWRSGVTQFFAWIVCRSVIFEVRWFRCGCIFSLCRLGEGHSVYAGW